MTNAVQEFERAFADYVGARYAIALCNGTATLHTALLALGVKPGDRVAVPPLTMSATTLAVLHAGAVPVFVDVDPRTWLMADDRPAVAVGVGVSLYGLHGRGWTVDDAAQTLRHHDPDTAFTSFSFQTSKILSLGEGGMLVTDDAGLAEAARSYSSLGYQMQADRPGIEKAALKVPGAARHIRVGWNYRMNALTASRGLVALQYPKMPGTGVEWCQTMRREAAALYADAIVGCEWLTPQHVPDGWGHDYWCWTVALDFGMWWEPLAQAIERHGGERPWPAWRLAYQEPALAYLAQPGGQQIDPVRCPVAEDLQPRLMQLQTNDLASAQRNAAALKRAIAEIEGR